MDHSKWRSAPNGALGPTGWAVPFLLVALVFLLGASAQTLRDDEQHLFAFLKNVHPGHSALFNSSLPVCQWPGLTCIGLGAQQRIYSLNLGGMQLNGSIPYGTLGALSALTVLDLSNNFLTGGIPYDLFNLSNLMHLGLSNNQLTGTLPWAVSNLYQLMKLDLAGNLFNGTLPPSLGDLWSLKFLDLHGNNFTGPVPALTHTKFLRYLDLSSNQFSGRVPMETFKIPEMLLLNLSRNFLSGTFPSELNWVWKIRIVDLSWNRFEGGIPNLSNLGQLRLLFVHSNGLNGSFPYNVTKLPYLNSLSVANNKLTGRLPSLPWGISSDKIRVLDCQNNLLTGRIPRGLLASVNLTIVRLGNNNFTGLIPTNITDQLEELDLHSNNLTGPMPPTFSRLRQLKKLDLSSNHLNGSIEWGVTTISALQYLSLAENQFSEGPLPDLSQMVNLMHLNLSSCNLTGFMPDSVGNLRSLEQLDLSHNHLTGSIPSSLSQVTNLTSLDLSYDNFTGEIPQELVSLIQLSRLNFSYNNLSGEIPHENQWMNFGDTSFLGNSLLCGLEVNRVCPPLLSPPLVPSAPVPTPMIQPPVHQPAPQELTTSAIVGIALGASLAFIAAVGTFILFHQKKTRRPQASRAAANYVTNPIAFETDPPGWAAQIPQPASIPVILFEKPLLNLTFADLLHATGKFHQDSQLSEGRYGPTFRGVLPGGFQIVVKVLYDGGSGNDLEKAAQLESLGKIRHQNLVSLMGYCLVAGERLLVYEHMENGNVYQRLHVSSEEAHHPGHWTQETWEDAHERFIASEDLSWPVRHRIAVGVARALAFLHHGSSPTVIHRDVTSSNIMLDNVYEPHLAGCGLAGLVEVGTRYELSPMMGGSLGYVPPEYGQTWNATPRGDVYSFGVVLLELVTGKRPTGQYFHDSYGGNLVGWVRSLIKEKQGYRCLDPKLLATGVESEMLETLRIGYLCTAEVPTKRPTMQQVVGLLKDIHVEVTYM